MSEIRPLLESDLEMILGWRNQESVRRSMYTQHEISPEEHLAWFRASVGNQKRHLLIYEEEAPLGFVNITEIRTGGIAEWGFYTSPDAAPGTGSRMGKAALDYAFHRLKMHRLQGEALSTNIASVRFHEKLGFIREGVLRDHFYNGSTYADVICFGMLADDWLR